MAARTVPRRTCAAATISWKRTRCHKPDAASKISRGETWSRSDRASETPPPPAPSAPTARSATDADADLGFRVGERPAKDRRGVAREPLRSSPSSSSSPFSADDDATRAGAVRAFASDSRTVPPSPALEVVALYAAKAARSTVCACARCFAASSKTSAVYATSSPTQYCASSRSARVASRCAARRRHAACDSYAYARTSSLAKTSQGTRCAAPFSVHARAHCARRREEAAGASTPRRREEPSGEESPSRLSSETFFRPLPPLPSAAGVSKPSPAPTAPAPTAPAKGKGTSATAKATAASAVAASAATRASSSAPQSAVSTPALTSSTIAFDARDAHRAAWYASATARGSATCCSAILSRSPRGGASFGGAPWCSGSAVGASASDHASSIPAARLDANSRRNADAMESRPSSRSFSRAARRRATSACACAHRTRPPDAARVSSAEKASGESTRSRLSIIASRARIFATVAGLRQDASSAEGSGSALTTTSGTPPTPFWITETTPHDTSRLASDAACSGSPPVFLYSSA